MAHRVGLYGGSFNPIHVGHLIVARSVAEQLALERVEFLCSAAPPHKRQVDLITAEHRAAMVRLAIEGEPRFAANDIDLVRPGPTYTIETVRRWRSAHPDAEPVWIIGGDSLAELPTWRDAGQLVDECRIVTATRPLDRDIDWTPIEQSLGRQRADRLREGMLATPVIDVSATDIRRRVAGGRSIRYLVPNSVADYIERHGLYQSFPDAGTPTGRVGNC